MNADYLPGCLESVLAQTSGQWECVVVNDASPDSSSMIAHSFAAKDSRFKVVDMPENVGLHRARREGVYSCSGDYIVFIDADDELRPRAVEDLISRLETDSADILHFGIEVVGEGVSQPVCEAFEDNVNRHVDRLDHDDLLKAVFSAEGGYIQDWRVAQRAYRASLLRDAFARMTTKRLERAEDCYEFLVIADCASGEITDNNIVALRYYFGRGVTGTSILERETFESHCAQFGACMDAVRAYANEKDNTLLFECAEGANEKLGDFLMNDWARRLADNDRRASLGSVVHILGSSVVAAQLMRLSRDAAYSKLTNHETISERDVCIEWFRMGEEVVQAQAEGNVSKISKFEEYRAQARQHIADLEHLSGWAEGTECHSPSLIMQSEYDAQAIRIFVTTHKDVNTFHSAILQPVQVGAKRPRKRLLWAFQDDSGESIADQNAMYCELTTQYWAWKNIKAEYYGFCHYRRYFDFSPEHHDENPYGEIMDDFIDWDSQKRYRLDDASMGKEIAGYDVVTTGINDVSLFPENYMDLRDHYRRAPYLNIADLDHMMAILREEHPDYSVDADTYLSGSKSCFCNMYVMRRDIFFRYCEWMFPMLGRFIDEWNPDVQCREMLRTPGHLSERLFNIFLIHEKRVNPQLKTHEMQCVHFEHPERAISLRVDPSDSHGLPLVPVVLAADNNYVPMVTTTVYSMMCNASSSHYYDVVILERDISTRNQRTMRDFFERFPNMSLRFVDVGKIIGSYDLQTNNEHISIETYYRFLIQEVLAEYSKVLYLDADLIVQGDISELYDIELGNNLLAAVRDIDYLGNLNMTDGKRMSYTKEVLGLKNPYGYFQAGVLLLNTHEMRHLHPLNEWMEIASGSSYIYDDQDILNAECQGRTVYLEDAWNVMIDCDGRFKKVFSFAPASVFDSFMTAYEKPKIIHYAGYEKPWKPGGCDMDAVYWMYARQTPFYERFLGMLYAEQVSVREDIAQAKEEVFYRLTTPPRAISEDSPLRSMFDGILPSGSRRREIAKSVVRKLRGR